MEKIEERDLTFPQYATGVFVHDRSCPAYESGNIQDCDCDPMIEVQEFDF